MWGCEDAKKRARGQEAKRARGEDVRMRRCEDEKMRDRPPLLEEPCAQKLSGTIKNATVHSSTTKTLEQNSDSFSWIQQTLRASGLLHKHFHTERLIHTDIFTHRRFHTQTLLHTDAFTHRHFYTQTLSHTDAFTQRRFYTETLLPTSPSMRGTSWNRNFTAVFDDRTSFHAKGLRRTSWNRNFISVFGDRTSFRAKGLRGTTWNRNFTPVFGDRTSFRAKGLRFVPSRWHCPCPPPSREK